MAKSKTPQWPRDHASKHAQAARKGWAKRRRSGDIAKFGGSSKHTEKTHYNKSRKKAAPKPAPTPARAAGPEPFELIATQKANGRWILSRRYKSGRIVAQNEKEYATNPLGERKVKAQQVPRGQGSLFGASQQRGIFDEE